jgi:glutamine synthetase adenylyltransferase
MRELRLAKGRIALLVALADIAGVWELEKVTAALSDFAQDCLIITITPFACCRSRNAAIRHSWRKQG